MLIHDAFDSFNQSTTIEVVSGLTRLGVPALAYEEAVRRGWRTTIDVACSKAFKYEYFPVHEVIIFGDQWGDESPMFINMIDVLICIGGGEQSHQAAHLARVQGKRIMEFEVSTLLSDWS